MQIRLDASEKSENRTMTRMGKGVLVKGTLRATYTILLTTGG